MHFLVYLGFILALCGISAAAPAAPDSLPQDGNLDRQCSIITVYVTVTGDPLLPEVRTFGNAAHHLDQTQNVGAIPDELTTTITRTNTRFETVIISGVSRSGTYFGESTSLRFLHDGPAPTEKEELNNPATDTTTFQPLNGAGGPEIPATVNTTSEDPTVPVETDGSKAPLTGNTVSQYLTAAAGTPATNDPVTINSTSQSLTAPTGTGVPLSPVTDNTTAPTGTQPVSGGDDVVIQTVIVYPVKSIAPETSSDNPLDHIHGGPPTPHDPVSASLFPTSNETVPTQTIGILANATIPAPSPPQVSTLAAMKGFANDETKPLERKNALGAAPVVVATPDAPGSVPTPPRDIIVPLAPLDAQETTFTLSLPFTTLTVTGEVSSTLITTGRSYSTYIPIAAEAALEKRKPLPVDSTTAPSTQLPATAIQSPPYKPISCGEQGIFRLSFDDIPRPAGPANSNDIQSQPIYSPYHHFYFSQGFVVASPPKDPYTPSSSPLLLEFVAQSNADTTRNHNSPPIDTYGATGEIGIGQNLQWGCYNFNALSASVGCDSLGPDCDWQFTGVQWDYETQVYKEVVTQLVSTASCPGLEYCKLADVVLLDEFMRLHALRVNVTVAGEPKGWWIDDLKLEWADGRCDAGLCRAMHR